MAKQLVSIRMSDTGVALLERLREVLGASQASVFEMALRELAEKKGVTIPEPAKKEQEKPAIP